VPPTGSANASIRRVSRCTYRSTRHGNGSLASCSKGKAHEVGRHTGDWEHRAYYGIGTIRASKKQACQRAANERGG
jgi:hypothetical protein